MRRLCCRSLVGAQEGCCLHLEDAVKCLLDLTKSGLWLVNPDSHCMSSGRSFMKSVGGSGFGKRRGEQCPVTQEQRWCKGRTHIGN